MAEDTMPLQPIAKRPRYEWPNRPESFGWFGVGLVIGVVLISDDRLISGAITIILSLFGCLRYNSGVGWVVVFRKVKDRLNPRKQKAVMGRSFSETALVLDGLKHHAIVSGPPVRLEPLPLRDQRGRVAQLGLLHSEKIREDTMTLAVRGWSKAGNADPAERIYHDTRWVRAIKAVANETGIMPRITSFVARRPTSAEPLLDYLERRIHPDISQRNKQALANLDQAIERTYTTAAGFYMGFTISAPRPRSWKQPLSKLDEATIRQAPIVRIYRTLESALQSIGLEGVRPVSYFDTNTLVRALLDPVGLPQFLAEVAEDKRLDRERRITSLDEAATLKNGPWVRTRAVDDALIAGRTWSATFWASSFDWDRVPVGVFDELFATLPGWYIISLPLEIQPREKARRSSNIKRKAIAIHNHTRVARTIEKPEEVERNESAEAEAWDIFRSASNTARFRFQVTVSTSSRETLEQYIDQEILSAFRNRGIRLTRYLDVDQQLPALLLDLGIAL